MTVYILSCWFFSIIRIFHTCQQHQDNLEYIWPDRKLQAVIFMMATCLLPYVFDPTSQAAWQLVKSYFPVTYYFYCGVLLFMFFGSVKQWKKWKTTSWIIAIIVAISLMPLILNAWIPGGVLNEKGLKMEEKLVLAVSLLTIPYCGLSMWKVWQCIEMSRDDNYSNPDDFPLLYAQRVWIMPIILTPLLWPAFLTDNQTVMAWLCIPLSIFNIILLINVMPAWRRAIILPGSTEHEEETDNRERTLTDERLKVIAKKIEEYVKDQQAYLDPHLKMEQVVDYCGTNRTYVSRAFKEHLGGFFNYVNQLRLKHYKEYLMQHSSATKDMAATASGFNSYQAFYKAFQRLKEKGNN